MNSLNLPSPVRSLRKTARQRPGKQGVAQRKPPGPSLLAHPHVLILGRSRAAKRMQAELKKAGIPARRTESPKETDGAIGETTRALFIVPPIANLSVARYCQHFQEGNKHLPVYVAFHGTLPSRSIRKLYDSGVQAVFEWPGDKEPLLRTAFRLAGGTALGTPAKAAGADIALEELVNNHLRTASTNFGKRLVARVKHRYVILMGKVDALWKLHVAEQVASHVSGVDDVVSNGVEVTGSAQTDRAIASAIRQVLKHATEVDPSTLAIRVKQGNVCLTGTTADRHELVRAVELIQHVRGVRSLENLATVSAKAKKKDRQVAKRVEEALATHHPKSAIDVTVFGGVAVLSGRVKKASDRMAIEALVAGQEGVDRVVDKIRVARTS